MRESEYNSFLKRRKFGNNANEVESCEAHELAKYFIALFSSL